MCVSVRPNVHCFYKTSGRDQMPSLPGSIDTCLSCNIYIR